jgi:hypothetical protein
MTGGPTVEVAAPKKAKKKAKKTDAATYAC